jgi:hypothetical protein
MGTNSSGRTNIFEKYAESIQQPFSMPFYRWKRCKNMGSYRVSQSLYPINGIIIIWGKVFIHSQYDILTDHMIAIWNTRNIYRIENPNWSRASYNIYLYKIWWYENYSYAIRIWNLKVKFHSAPYFVSSGVSYRHIWVSASTILYFLLYETNKKKFVKNVQNWVYTYSCIVLNFSYYEYFEFLNYIANLILE